MRIILLSGAHGVGKGFFLNKVRENIRQYDVYSASDLIERYQPSTDAGYKKVNNVNKNQEILIKAIYEAERNGTKDILLDGHLCVFNAKEEVERIPKYFFAETKISGIVILQDKPEIIADRIKKRDANEISIQDIALMQSEENRYASELQVQLGIQYKIITHECTGEKFEEILKKLGGDFVE